MKGLPEGPRVLNDSSAVQCDSHKDPMSESTSKENSHQKVGVNATREEKEAKTSEASELKIFLN